MGFCLHGLISFASIAYQVASSGLPYLVSSNVTLVLLCTIVLVKRRVGTVLFLSRVAKGCRPTVECAAVFEVTRMKQ